MSIVPTLVFAAVCLPGVVRTQGDAADAAGIDPYTKAEPAAMARAGIAALQRFAWAEDHTTVGIQSLMGFEPFRFIETAHFKVASSLPTMAVPADAAGRRALRAELVALKARLPGVDIDARTLDPWLRTHLYAHRLERAYAEFAARFGISEAAMARCAPGGAFAVDYAGEGPHLGQRGKFLVVLARSGASLGSYARNFLDLPAPRTTARHHLARSGSLLLLTAEDLPEQDLRRDQDLHAAVAYHAAHLFVDAFRSYWHDCPAWFEEGVAHWFRARVAPSRAVFALRPRWLPRDPGAPDWAANVRARLAHGSVVPADELFRLRNEALRFEDHLAAWSRVDFLLTAHPDAFPLFARTLKGPDPSVTPPTPSAAEIEARQARALTHVFGWSPADFDAQWSAWALRTYPKT